MKPNLLITGCNRGIGRAIMELFASKGYNVIACVRTVDDEFRKLIETLREQGTECSLYNLDMMDEESIKTAIKDIYKSKVTIDVLINNAGVVANSLLQMTTIKQLRDVFQVNFFGHVQFTQGISKIMMRQKSGNIINMCSIGGMDAYPAYTAYGCSKAAMIYFTKTLAQEMAVYGVRVNGIAPSMTDTRMKDAMGEEANEEIMNRTSLKRIARPSEIADLAFYLASGESSFINGQVIRIDGGMMG